MDKKLQHFLCRISVSVWSHLSLPRPHVYSLPLRVCWKYTSLLFLILQGLTVERGP